MTRRLLLQACLAVIGGGLNIIRFTPHGKRYADSDPKFGQWPMYHIHGRVDCDDPKGALFYDECGRRVHPVGWCFHMRKAFRDNVFEGCLCLCFVSPHSPSADELHYSSEMFNATMKFIGDRGPKMQAAFDRDQKLGLTTCTSYQSPTGGWAVTTSIHERMCRYGDTLRKDT